MEDGKERETWCNYIVISKIKGKKGSVRLERSSTATQSLWEVFPQQRVCTAPRLSMTVHA